MLDETGMVEVVWDTERQEALEDQGFELGQQRFEKRVARDSRNVGGGRKLVGEALSRVSFRFHEWLQRDSSTTGPTPPALKWIKALGADQAALIAVRECFSCLHGPQDVTQVARAVSQWFVWERKAAALREVAPHLFKHKKAAFRTRSLVHMARSMAASLSSGLQCRACREERNERCPHITVPEVSMTERERLIVGTRIVREVMDTMPEVLTTSLVQTGRRNRQRMLTLAPEAAEWVENRNDAVSALVPVALPMVVPPEPWGPGQAGGYRYRLRGVFPFARTSKSQAKRIEEAADPVVYEAVNRLQETPYRIAQGLLNVVAQLAERGLVDPDLGLPQLEPYPVPEPLGDNPSPEEVKQWKTARARVHDMEANRVSLASPFLSLMSIANIVKDEQAFWFPHNLDFRGRVYPIPAHLQPQGSDMARGLLEYADGVELGERGVFWLAVHLANTLDEHQGLKLSKLPLEERFQWVQNHSEALQRVGNDPLSNSWWRDADKPWQFLAACIEWARYVDYGPGMVSHLPVSIDGSCNGLQHMAAILRDPTGAQAVNVTANEVPEDVYQRTTDWVLDRLVEEAKDEPLARSWLKSGLVDRKMTKRPTMTFGYGGTLYGFADQIQEQILAALGREGWSQCQTEHFWNAEQDRPTGTQAVRYLANLIYSGLGHIVPGAVEFRGWIQEAAKVVVKGGRPVSWTVPLTGFPVAQDRSSYFKSSQVRVETTLGAKVRYTPTFREVSRDPHSTKQVNGVAPNFVHSLDAGALMLTIHEASQAGIGSFTMVHDSFGTHAGNMDLLRDATRSSFYRLYTRRDVVQELYQELLNQVPSEAMADLPEPPALGDLDIGVVLTSEYFFA